MLELFASELNLDEQQNYSIFQIVFSIFVSLMAGIFLGLAILLLE